MSTLELVLDNIGGSFDKEYTVLEFKVYNLNQNIFQLNILKLKNDDLIKFIYGHLKTIKDIDREEIIFEKDKKIVSNLCNIINKIINKKRLTIYQKGPDYVSLTGFDIFIYNEWERITLWSSCLSHNDQYSIDSYFE